MSRRGTGGGGGSRRSSNHRSGGRRGGGGGRGGHRSRRRSDPRQSSESGNQRERIAVESGNLVFIDQFMLANPQFIDKIREVIDDGPEAKDKVIQQYGGSVVEIEPGTYKIERDPFAFSIVVHPQGDELDPAAVSRENATPKGHVYVDTRCVAMIDRELLDDTALLEKYQQLWFTGQDKACRDLIRDNGGAVRYGFHRYGDELGIYQVPDTDIVCLWPDIVEPAAEQSAG